MKKYFKALIIGAFLAGAVSFTHADGKEDERILIFAAASTTDAVNELISEFKKSSNVKFAASYASSGALAKQIVQGGAEVNIFISADTESMEILEKAGKAEKGTKFLFGKNSLVIVSSPKTATAIKKPDELIEALGKDGKLAMGDPKHVPAGRYALAALEYYGIYERLSGGKKIALYGDARQTLNAVELAQAEYGIVYRTDADKSKKAKIAYSFEAKSYGQIEYPACAVAENNTANTQLFLKFMQSNKGRAIIKKYGF